VEFFKVHGFLIKRGLLPKPALTEQVDKIWSRLSAEQPSVTRPDKGSHVDPHRHWTVTEGPSTTEDGSPTSRNWPMSFTGAGDWNWHGLGSDPDWLSATSAHPNVLHVVEALIGGPVKVPTRNRGIYCMFPHEEPGKLGPHHDWHPFDLGGMAYIGHVAPYSGGTTLWPGSHLRLLPHLPNEQACGFYTNDAYVEAKNAAIEEVQPVEITGGPGDFLFFHPCMIHSRGLNSVVHGSGELRIASPQDFQRSRQPSNLMWQLSDGRLVQHDGSFPLKDNYHDNGRGNRGLHSGAVAKDAAKNQAASGEGIQREETGEEEGNLMCQLIWHHDTLEYAPHVPLQKDDLWSTWNLGKLPVVGEKNWVRDPSWWDRYNVEMCTPNTPLHELADKGADGVWRLR
jgi:hypothetical protein